jgi:predicted RNA binding protein YcfA (HicA-like mRNA interferase family)
MKLPVVSARDCIRVLQKAGFEVIRQTGSHITMARKDPSAKVIVPSHKEIAPGTLRNILRQADMTVDEFVKLLKD